MINGWNDADAARFEGDPGHVVTRSQRRPVPVTIDCRHERVI
jgi:hypothetical protein